MSDYRARCTSVGDCMNELSIPVSVLRFADCFYQAHPGPLCDVIKEELRPLNSNIDPAWRMLTATEDWRIKRLLHLRFDCDSTRRSGHHDSVLMKARIHTRRHFTSGVVWKGYTNVNNRKIRCYPMLIPPRECYSYYYREVLSCVIIYDPPTAFLLDTTHLDATKKWTCSFFVVVESKSNRSCNSRFICSVEKEVTLGRDAEHLCHSSWESDLWEITTNEQTNKQTNKQTNSRDHNTSWRM